MSMETKPEFQASKTAGKGVSGGVKGISGAAIAAGAVGFAKSKGWLPEGYEVTALVFLTGLITAGLNAGSNFVKHKWGITIPIVTGLLILLAPAFVLAGCAKTVHDNGSWEFTVNMDSVERAALLTLDLTQRIQLLDQQMDAMKAEQDAAKAQGKFDRFLMLTGEIERLAAVQREYANSLKVQGKEVKAATKTVPKIVADGV